jgi:SNF2 family DNA or RNA helicase
VRLLDAFQNDRKIERIAFIGQPGAAGMGLNLTASPSVIYYSNDFNAESRIQSEDRIHRPGMDRNRGATIYDLLLLPSDLLVLNNLKRKRRLQDLSLGEMRDEIAAIKWSDIRNF